MSSPERVMASVEYLNQAASKLEDNHGKVLATNGRLFSEAVPLVTSSWMGEAAKVGARIVTGLEADARTLADLLAKYFPAVRQAAASFGAQEQAAAADLQRVSGNTLNLDINRGPVNLGG